MVRLVVHTVLANIVFPSHCHSEAVSSQSGAHLNAVDTLQNLLLEPWSRGSLFILADASPQAGEDYLLSTLRGLQPGTDVKEFVASMDYLTVSVQQFKDAFN